MPRVEVIKFGPDLLSTMKMALDAALLSPASTHRTMASRPFGVRGAFLWLFIWSLRGTRKLRNLSFLGSDQMDNLLKDHI